MSDPIPPPYSLPKVCGGCPLRGAHVYASIHELNDATTLTPREMQTLLYVAGGFRNIDIAKAQQVATATVKSCLTSAFRKIGARSRVDACRFVFAHGLASPNGKP